MKRIILTCILVCSVFFCKAQVVQYRFIETISESQSEVTFKINVFCEDKELLDHSAKLSAIRNVIFYGVDGTRFNKPLLDESESSLVGKHKSYFESLYNTHYVDFIKDCSQTSKFKKSGDGKSTTFQVTVKIFELRRHLEKNRIKTKFGI